MTFADTGGWCASYVTIDPEHEVALAWYLSNTDQLVTTDYVVDELLTLLRARGQDRMALGLGTLLLSDDLCRI